MNDNSRIQLCDNEDSVFSSRDEIWSRVHWPTLNDAVFFHRQIRGYRFFLDTLSNCKKQRNMGWPWLLTIFLRFVNSSGKNGVFPGHNEILLLPGSLSILECHVHVHSNRWFCTFQSFERSCARRKVFDAYWRTNRLVWKGYTWATKMKIPCLGVRWENIFGHCVRIGIEILYLFLKLDTKYSINFHFCTQVLVLKLSPRGTPQRLPYSVNTGIIIQIFLDYPKGDIFSEFCAEEAKTIISYDELAPSSTSRLRDIL